VTIKLYRTEPGHLGRDEEGSEKRGIEVMEGFLEQITMTYELKMNRSQ
jgi:hypothetical protein